MPASSLEHASARVVLTDPLGQRPALDGLRAIAITTVVVSHTAYSRRLPGGGVGVDLFFVLSGFLITTLLIEEHARRATIDIAAFYARRALRLLPALVALLAGVFALSFVPALAEATPVEVLHFSAYVFTYTANWVLALQSRHWPALLGHLWSLSVEEQYYLLWPLLVRATLSRRVPTRTVLVALVASISAAALWRALVWHATHDVHRVYFATDCRASGLLAGSALAVLRSTGWRPSPRWRDAAALGGLVLYSVAVTHLDRQTAYPALLGLKLVELAGGLLVLAYGFVAAPAGGAILQGRCAVWIGRRSYAIYLWHVPILYAASHMLDASDAVRTTVGVALTVGMAAISWRLVEQPALRRKQRFSRDGTIDADIAR